MLEELHFFSGDRISWFEYMMHPCMSMVFYFRTDYNEITVITLIEWTNRGIPDNTVFFSYPVLTLFHLSVILRQIQDYPD